MSSRKTNFVVGEYYHVYNRGIDGRDIFSDSEDLTYFIKRTNEFNGENVVGGLYRGTFAKYKDRGDRLVDILCYAFNPNHFHFLLTPLVENGIENFIQRLCTGHAMFFNKKYRRRGSLFQGAFKSIHIDSNEYLLHLSVYINLNNQVHQLRGLSSQLSRTSWDSYISNRKDLLIGDIGIITEQFKDWQEYKKFAEDILPDIIERKKILKEIEKIMIE